MVQQYFRDLVTEQNTEGLLETQQFTDQKLAFDGEFTGFKYTNTKNYIIKNLKQMYDIYVKKSSIPSLLSKLTLETTPRFVTF